MEIVKLDNKQLVRVEIALDNIAVEIRKLNATIANIGKEEEDGSA